MLIIVIGTILGTIVGLFISIINIITEGLSLEEIWLSFLMLVGSIIVGIGLSFLLALAIPADYEIKVETLELANLQDNPASEGNFFLGIGSINGTMKYTFYCETDSGVYEMRMINYNEVKIIPQDSIPRVELTKKVLSETKKNEWVLGVSEKTIEKKIYVPKGTIKENYILDAQ